MIAKKASFGNIVRTEILINYHLILPGWNWMIVDWNEHWLKKCARLTGRRIVGENCEPWVHDCANSVMLAVMFRRRRLRNKDRSSWNFMTLCTIFACSHKRAILKKCSTRRKKKRNPSAFSDKRTLKLCNFRLYCVVWKLLMVDCASLGQKNCAIVHLRNFSRIVRQKSAQCLAEKK